MLHSAAVSVFISGGGTIEADRILIIENDEALAVEEADALKLAGYEIVMVSDALDGLKKLQEARPDLIIMDRELPMAAGEDPCLRIRQASYLPIIVIGNEEDTVETLEMGADAYISKPPSPIELVARVRALLRRIDSHYPPGNNSRSDNKSRLPERESGAGGSTRTEFHLASCLMLIQSRLLGYPRLASEVWGGKRIGFPTLYFYIGQLRRKLTSFRSELKGVGYHALVDASEAGDSSEDGSLWRGAAR